MESGDYSVLMDIFSQDTIQDRYDNLETEIKKILTEFNLSKHISINIEAFNSFLESYFMDIARLKQFAKIERANIAKVFGYTVYWFCRMHPLNIIDENSNHAFINERVILYIHIRKLLNYMYINSSAPYAYGQILESCELILYVLKYRIYTPQMLECAFLNLLNGTTVNTVLEPLFKI